MSSHRQNRISHKMFLSLLCLLWLINPAKAHETLTTTVLFDREIVRILDRHCVMCHSENGPSFPLETYEQTWLRGRKIRADAIARTMPPWAAFPGYGQFANDNSLTLRETQFIVSWVEGLGPRNSGTVFTNVADATGPRPAVRAKADFGHWQLGAPAAKRQIGGKGHEPGQGNVIKQTVVDLGLTAERRLRGMEYMPGDRHAVSAAFFTIKESGQSIGRCTRRCGDPLPQCERAFRRSRHARSLLCRQAGTEHNLRYRARCEDCRALGTLSRRADAAGGYPCSRDSN